MDKRIVKFISTQTCLTVCCIDEAGLPYCFNCFYVFDEGNEMLYYKSSPSAHHSICLLQNGNISGTIMPDRLNKYAIQGIQFCGHLVNIEKGAEDYEHANDMYHSHFPMARTMNGTMYTLQLNSIKMSDNLLGIRRNIAWNRSESELNIPMEILKEKG